MRRCEWCKDSLTGRRSDALYCSTRCRVLASKARRGVGVHKPYQTPSRASSGPSGIQVSYPKAVEAAADLLVAFGALTRFGAEAEAAMHMATKLSPAQRARLEARS